MKLINEELIQVAGGSQVLECQAEIKGQLVYLRMSETSFVSSSVSLQEVIDGNDGTTFAYWEVGACTPEVADHINDEIWAARLFPAFQQMKKSWIEAVGAIKEPSEANIRQLVYEGLEGILVAIYDLYNIKSGDIMPEQSLVWDELADRVTKLFKELADLNMEVTDNE